MPESYAQNHESGNKRIKLNTEVFLEQLQKIPEPDTYSLDFIWEAQWLKIYPAESLIFDFKRSGILKVSHLGAEHATQESQWSISPKSKELTIETILEDSAFEIEFQVFNVVFITSDWLILQSHHEDPTDPFLVFTRYNEDQKAQKSLQDLYHELNESQSSEKPNTFLLLMIFAIFLIIMILMMSL